MSEDNSNYRYLKFREVFNETLLRDLILFLVFYLFILSQDWQNFFLLSFPTISFGFSLFFKIVNTNKEKIYNFDSKLVYNPIGLEKVYANRLNFISIFQLILLFWIGAESIYHPQLIKEYDFYFISLFSFIYSFGFYWLFIDLWSNSKIAVKLSTESSILQEPKEIILSNLRYRKFRFISLLNLSLFLCLNIINIIFQLLIELKLLSGFEIYLPGTGVENSNPPIFSFLVIIILIIFPLFCSFSLILIYRDITAFNNLELTNFLNKIPLEIRLQIIANLKKIHKKVRNFLERE
ncbi:MAG: hypothetical protein ACFFKA_13410 [Candidatus Thorarchaeota archaeon]